MSNCKINGKYHDIINKYRIIFYKQLKYKHTIYQFYYINVHLRNNIILSIELHFEIIASLII